MMQDTIDRLCQHYRSLGPVILLESQSADHPAGRNTFLAALPKASIKASGRNIEVREENKEKEIRFESNPWEALRRFRQKQGGWLFGYLGYDLKNHIEELSSLNNDDVKAPDLFFIEPGLLLEFDLREQTMNALTGTLPDQLPDLETEVNLEVEDLQTTMTKKEYLSIIEKAKKNIWEGEFYEINLSRQLQARCSGSPYQLYRQMRAVGPVPFGAFMQFDDFSVCSMSPERFLSKKGATVFSQPIKGTMRRHKKPAKDRALKSRLTHSTKNKAENLMIVDLVRNDLSRIAVPGSVQVPELFAIQTFGTVHQMVSTVSAQAVSDDPVEIIKACYPMGSMTGAPKISAMRSIEQLENYRRGIYSGAIGYIAPGGDFDFNVVIRTAIIKNEQLYYAVGGAITGDSDPEEEWRETRTKAQALRKAVENAEIHCHPDG